MYDRRAFTMIEIIVVAAIMCGSLGMLIFWQRSSNSANQISAQEQEYANLLSRLSAALRADLRSAASISHPGSTTWVLSVWSPDEKGVPVLDEVRYSVSGKDGAVVSRSGYGRNVVFDFAGLLGGKRFVFEIEQ